MSNRRSCFSFTKQTCFVELLGSDAFIVTPGVRPTGASLDDQSRVMTPKEAFDQGASHIVIGRPVTVASDPRAAFDEIVKGL